jgi:lipoprotein-releasing system permease protein
LKFPLYIAKRYLFSGSKNNAINIITAIASMSIIVGSMALFVVLSVFSGLKDMSLSYTNDFDPDLKITSSIGKSFVIQPQQESKISKIKDIAVYSKIIEERALFTFNGKDQLAYIKGVDSNFYHVNQIEKSIFQGNWIEADSYDAVIGAGIAQKLSVGLFDMNNLFEVFVPKAGKGTINNPEDAFKRSILEPVGFYFLNEDLNQKYVFTDIVVAQDLLQYKPNQISGIEVKLHLNANEDKVKEELQTILGAVEIKNRAQLNDALYRMLNTENIVLYLIFTLVIIVTLFTLIGALIMIIIEKKSNLKTLNNIGLEINNIKKIFLYQGFLICVIGGIIGWVLGIIVVLLQQHFNFFMITQTMPYPVIFNIQNSIIVLLTIFTLGYLASWAASSRVSKKLLES